MYIIYVVNLSALFFHVYNTHTQLVIFYIS